MLTTLSACSSPKPIVALQPTTAPRDSIVEAAEQELVLGALQLNKGDARSAAEQFQHLLTQQPSNAALHYALAKAFIGMGKLDSARVHSEQSVTLQGSNPAYLQLLVALAHEEHDYRRAIEVCQQLLSLDPDKSDVQLVLAHEYVADGQHSKALTLLQELVTREPSNEGLRAELLLLQVRFHRYQEAIENVQQLLQHDDANKQLRMTLAELYQQTKQYPEAATAFQEVLQQYPRFLPAWIGLLDASAHHGNNNMFSKTLQRCYNESHAPFEAHVDIARFFIQRAKQEPMLLPSATTIVQALQQHYPRQSRQNVAVTLLKAELFVTQEKYNEASQLFELALRQPSLKKQKTLYVQAGNILTLCYEKLALARKSIRLYKQLLRVEPSNMLITNNLAYTLATEHRELVRAEKLARKAVAAEPQNPVYLDTLGWVLYQKGEYQKAGELLEKAAALNTQEVEILEHLLQVYQKLGNSEKATDVQQRLLKLR